MKVLIVCNNAYVPGNGICTSARVTKEYLRREGIDARFLTSENADPDGPQPEFRLKRMYFPIFQPIIDANGFCYATIDRKIIREAVEWADVIHIEEALFLQHAVIKIAEKMGKPVVGTFHMYTQNILQEIPFASFGLSNRLLMADWRNNFYNHCTDVQCPTVTVKRLLEKNGFKSRLHVISNGVRIPREPVVASKPQMSPYLILNISRFAKCKGQQTLLEAMKYSRHAHEIQLYFAGNGVYKEKCQSIADSLVSAGILNLPPVFAFHTREELRTLAEKAYLYVHTASIEVEGLGCLEAIREGAVPVIAKGDLIATSDFALDDRSVFPVWDAESLAQKIDWWIEHPEERLEMGQRYADSARNYGIHASIDSLIKMYSQAVSEKK